MTIEHQSMGHSLMNLLQPKKRSLFTRPTTKPITKRSTIVSLIVAIGIIVPTTLYIGLHASYGRTFDYASKVTSSSDDFKIIVAHAPRNDLLGSFVLPTLFLYAITTYQGWELKILPFAGSESEAILKHHFSLGDKLGKDWGNGFQDASHREGYDPVELNSIVYDILGFFPPVSDASILKLNWTSVVKLPQADEIKTSVCKGNVQKGNECYILMSDDTYKVQAHFEKLGGIERVFPDSFRNKIRSKFLEVNQHRLRHLVGTYNIAIHVRRGDVLDPSRWIQQHVYAIVARQICQKHPDANVHVFSSGPNRDGNWSSLENIVNEIPDAINKEPSKCASVAFHFDELEFDSWTHMVAADALITSKSTFSYVPALLSGGEVYFPNDYWHPTLSSFILFDSATGEIQSK